MYCTRLACRPRRPGYARSPTMPSLPERASPRLLASIAGAVVPLLLVGAAARAEPIVVLGAEAVGVPDAQAVALTEALRAELKKRPRAEVMPGKDYVEMRLLFGCTEEAQLGACMAQVGRSLVADKLVLATLHGDTPAAKASG